MTPQRWQQVKSTLAEALEQDDTTARAALLDVRCAGDTTLRREVDSLLGQDDDAFAICADSGGLLQTQTDRSENVGRRVGAYELVRELGRGGMGSVWLARRADREFQKEVAIKLLKRGTDTDEVLRRFRAEREILARLEHPNIARLLDGGTTDDDLPYLVMEYVPGVRVTDFVRDQQPSWNDRLQLFLKICSAVELAHQNLVVHRDLKPGNILVTAEGEPKLLDFGIAKVLGAAGEQWEMTVAGRERLTPGYASPEQVRGEPVTTVSDVYALGAILYELLAERPAHRFGQRQPTATEILRVVCNDEPVRPSLAAAAQPIRRSLRGDLDTIVLRALAKAPERRYRGAGSLADDIRRYLDGRPVRARPDTIGYRAAKFIGRNKTAVTAATLLVATLIAGAATTLWQARRADRRFDEVRKIANSFMFEFHDAIRDLPGALAARQLVTRRALEYLDSLAAEAGNDATLQSELALAYDRVGEITFDTRQAIASHLKAAALYEALVAAEPGNTSYRERLAESYTNVSDCTRVGGRSDQSLDYARKAVAIAESLVAANPSNFTFRDHLAHRYCTLAFNLIDAGESKFAMEVASQAVSTAQEVVAKDPGKPDPLETLHRAWAVASYALEELGDLQAAFDYSRRHMEAVRAEFDAAPSNARYRRKVWAAQFRTGRQLALAGDLDQAYEHLSGAVEMMESFSAADPNDDGHRRWLAVSLTSLADVEARRGDLDRALPLHRRAAEISAQLVANDRGRVEARRDLARMRHAIGTLLGRRGDLEGALVALDHAATLAEASVAEDPTNTRVRSAFADICATIARTHRARADRTSNEQTSGARDYSEAISWARRSSELWQEIVREDRVNAADAHKPAELERELATMKAALAAAQ